MCSIKPCAVDYLRHAPEEGRRGNLSKSDGYFRSIQTSEKSKGLVLRAGLGEPELAHCFCVNSLSCVFLKIDTASFLRVSLEHSLLFASYGWAAVKLGKAIYQLLKPSTEPTLSIMWFCLVSTSCCERAVIYHSQNCSIFGSSPFIRPEWRHRKEPSLPPGHTANQLQLGRSSLRLSDSRVPLVFPFLLAPPPDLMEPFSKAMYSRKLVKK